MIILNLIFSILTSLAGAAEQVKLVAIDYPPFAVQKDNKVAGGVGVSIVREIAKRTGIQTLDSAVPVAQIGEISENDNALFAIVTRNPERENLFRWIGKMTDDRYCFVTLKENKPIDTLNAAKNLSEIGVNKGGATEKYLLNNGFKNLSPAMGNSGSVRKLYAKKISAWFSSEYVAKYSIKFENEDPNKSVCSGDITKVGYWVAASKKMTQANFEKAQAAYLALEKEGFIQNALAPYK